MSQYRHRRTSNPATPFPNPLEPGEIAVNTSNRQIAVGDAHSGAVGAPLPLIAVRFFDTRAVYAAGDLVEHSGSTLRAIRANGPGAFIPGDWASASVQIAMADTAPTGMLPGSLFWETDTGSLYILYDDGDSVQWVIATPQLDPALFVQRSGDAMNGPLALVGDPTTAMQAATKQYVDARDVAVTDVANTKVAKAGDVMTGDLRIGKASPAVILDKTGTQDAYILGQTNGKSRWLIDVATAEAESTGNVGSNFVIYRYDDAGNNIGYAVSINRASGGTLFAGSVSPSVNAGFNLGSASQRWGTVFTSDLDLSNGIGDWTIVEGEYDLFIYNNKRDKVYKFALTEVDPDTAPPKKD